MSHEAHDKVIYDLSAKVTHQDCVKRGYCYTNPLDYADMPKNQSKEIVEGDNIRILNKSEVSNLLDAVTEQKYHVLFSLAIFSGARQGELLGLKWSDIQWQDSQIHIQRGFIAQRPGDQTGRLI